MKQSQNAKAVTRKATGPSKMTKPRHNRPPTEKREIPLGISEMSAEDVQKSMSRKNDLDDRRFSTLLRDTREPTRFGVELRLVAVDGKKYSGSEHAVLPQCHQLHFYGQLNAMDAPNPEIVAAGMPIWRSLNLNIDPLLAYECLSLKQLDPDTSDAFNAALFHTRNTAQDGCDLSTAAFAIAAFVHAHPRFSDLAAELTYELPFGKDTAWALFSDSLR